MFLWAWEFCHFRITCIKASWNIKIWLHHHYIRLWQISGTTQGSDALLYILNNILKVQVLFNLNLHILKTARPFYFQNYSFTRLPTQLLQSVVVHKTTTINNTEKNKQNNSKNAQNRNRTGTEFNFRRILSPVRLPVPPPGQKWERKDSNLRKQC